MYFVRAAALFAMLGSLFIAAGCGGSSGVGTPPIRTPGQIPGALPVQAPSPTPGRSTMSTTQYTLQGTIDALKTGGFQIEAGPGYGYVNIYPTKSTILNYNGLTPKVGIYAVVIAETNQGGDPISITLYPSKPGSPSPAPSNVPTHVLTAGIIWTSGGTPTSVPLSSMSPYVSWVMTSPSYASEIRAAGIKVGVYMNFWRNYTSDNPTVGYVDLEPGGQHADAEAKLCNGTVIKDPSYGGGYEANALLTPQATAHAEVVASYRESEFSGNYDALFADDTGALWGIATPCGYTDSAYKTGTNAVHAAIAKPMFVNTLNAGTSVVSQVGYTTASDVLGGMCESCYVYWTTINGIQGDYPRTGSTWLDTENGEALMVADKKIFWEYGRAVGSASAETGLRNYAIASFLLTYDPRYAMLQEAFSTPSQFEVMPESGLVPMSPATTYTNAASYEQTGGSYMREFGACYYRGVDKGKCAVVVNPSATMSASIPTHSYGHSMVLSGNGVLDGGSVSFTGGVPSSLPPASGIVLFP